MNVSQLISKLKQFEENATILAQYQDCNTNNWFLGELRIGPMYGDKSTAVVQVVVPQESRLDATAIETPHTTTTA